MAERAYRMVWSLTVVSDGNLCSAGRVLSTIEVLDQAAPGKAQTRAGWVAAVLLVAYCSVGALTVIAYSALLLHNRWENSYFESPQTYAALHAAQTGQLYLPMSAPPYTPQAYTPLYYAVNGVTAWIAGLDIDRFIFYARCLTFLAYLLAGLLVYSLCRVAAIQRTYALLAALMMLGQPDFLGWNVSPRPDMLYLFAMLLSLFCAMKWSNRPWLGYGLAGFLGGIAFLIKQPGLTVVAAIFVFLVAHKEFRKAAILAGSAVVPVAIVFGVLWRRHDPFFQQLSFVGNSLWSVSNTAHFSTIHLLSSYWLVPACIGVLGFPRAIRANYQSRLLAVFAAMNWLMGFATLPQVGGYLNYLLPGLAGSALLLPYAIEAIRARSRSIVFTAVASAVIVLATFSAFRYTRDLGRYYRAPTTDSLNWLKPYRVISDLTTLNMHGRDPELLDPFGAHVLELTGHWDATPLIENLRQGKYDLIIFTRVNLYHVLPEFRGVSYLGPEETKALNENYQMLCSTIRRLVLKPKGREIPLTPDFFSRVLGGPCLASPPSFRMNFSMAADSR